MICAEHGHVFGRPEKVACGTIYLCPHCLDEIDADATAAARRAVAKAFGRPLPPTQVTQDSILLDDLKASIRPSLWVDRLRW